MIEISDGISISDDELVFRFSRSAGPGGQNVNKVNTRVTVFFDVAGCAGFSDPQKERILKRLRTRASKNGVLHVASQRHRTQSANRRTATDRLVELVRWALKKPAVRKKTKVPYRAVQKRLEEKKQRGMLKQQRTKRIPVD